MPFTAFYNFQDEVQTPYHAPPPAEKNLKALSLFWRLCSHPSAIPRTFLTLTPPPTLSSNSLSFPAPPLSPPPGQHIGFSIRLGKPSPSCSALHAVPLPRAPLRSDAVTGFGVTHLSTALPDYEEPGGSVLLTLESQRMPKA